MAQITAHMMDVAETAQGGKQIPILAELPAQSLSPQISGFDLARSEALGGNERPAQGQLQ
jgi:hypothetical protein